MTSRSRSGSVRASDRAGRDPHGRVSPQPNVRQDAARVGKLRLLQRDHHHRRHDADPERVPGAVQSEESSRESGFPLCVVYEP